MNSLIKSAKDFVERIHPMPQNALTIKIPIIKSKEHALRQLLAKINQNPPDNAILPFSVFSQLHFARFLLLDGPDHPKTYETSLIFMANIDGTLSDFIDELLKHVSGGLDQILCACIGYPIKSKRNQTSRRMFLTSHTLECQAFYINTVGRTAKMIRQESELRDALQLFLNDLDPSNFKSSRALRRAVIKFVENNPEIAWALAARPKPSLLWRTVENIRFAAMAALGILIIAWCWPILVAWAVTLRLREYTDEEAVSYTHLTLQTKA